MKIQFKTNIVERYQNGESLYQIAEDKGRDYTTLLRELRRKGVDTSQRYWTKEEKEKLKKLYPVSSTKELLKEFPNRTKGAIRAIASKLMARKEKYKKICEVCGKEFTITHRSSRKYKTICSLCAIKKWGHEHSENRRKSRRKWEQENPEYKKDPKFRLDQNMGCLICYSLRSKKAGRKWESLVNYTLEELIEHLETQFDGKMNWENYGSYWQIDHIKPRSLFKYTFPEDPEFKECWNLENLQPLEKTANLKKSNTFAF